LDFQFNEFDPHYATDSGPWLGPEEPPEAPFDTACPTGRRPKEVDEKYLRQMNEMMRKSAMPKADKKLTLAFRENSSLRCKV